jgi:hypothetical protein
VPAYFVVELEVTNMAGNGVLPGSGQCHYRAIGVAFWPAPARPN